MQEFERVFQDKYTFVGLTAVTEPVTIHRFVNDDGGHFTVVIGNTRALCLTKPHKVWNFAGLVWTFKSWQEMDRAAKKIIAGAIDGPVTVKADRAENKRYYANKEHIWSRHYTIEKGGE